jgi:CTP:molybdopterin cytidylyltransferase MocA
MRRGHPLLVDRQHWDGILALSEPQTLREFFKGADRDLAHVAVETPSVLQDMDTPADYQRALQEYASR